jgi:3,4-dihydroxy 2-butanone 4-phosphate synthase
MDVQTLRDTLLSGNPILVFDFEEREGETDMVYYAENFSWRYIRRLRRDAGGLICYVIGEPEAKSLLLEPLYQSLNRHPSYHWLVKKPSYGDFPAFSLWVNHVSTKTGISDFDRAKTISELHKVVEIAAKDPSRALSDFRSGFYAPGHVPVLVARSLSERRGHTELVASLATILGLKRSMVIAEMLGPKYSLTREAARRYAMSKGLPLVSGKEILEAKEIEA